MRITITGKENLAKLLTQAGHAPDLRCGGRGSCGRCTVKLLSGAWESQGRIVRAPADVLSCKTRLLSECGEIEFTPPAAQGNIADEWTSIPLPPTQETVIGVDLGTTTVAAVKLHAGKIVGRAGAFNQQSRYGDNVIERIAAARHDLTGLRQAALDSIAPLLSELGLENVQRIAIAGNTVMSCLFHGIDPSSIGEAPFTPPTRSFAQRSDCFGSIPVLTVPCISGFIGGDLTAGLGEVSLAPGEMLVDIGTNCEIVYHAPDGRWLCTSAAAGPAFEGAGLRFGSRAVPGAIDHYYGRGAFSVLGGQKPCGMCGSAYIDFLAVERSAGRLTEFGRVEPAADCLPVTDSITVSEQEIEQLLKAKAAVRAGILTLEAFCKTRADRIFLAGGFARYLDLSNAIRAGMLPVREYAVVGNTSLAGAVRLAASPSRMAELKSLSDLPQELPLNLLPDFETNYLDGMLLE